ncbi:hypothetical protein H6P81_001839 [Aristolochia fimbriata]|uniref:Amidase domain-containing protein n=1 Tax=Aristolochia fimbriata TaxID=158543 RepID=A0AAV7FB96_ARIFI|nr:hypothetical protein H6P81_001839 [Aristolochia fimbriata]
MAKFIMLFFLVLVFVFVGRRHGAVSSFEIEEATIDGIHKALGDKSLSSRKLVEFYLNRIQALNPKLNAVIEVNPDALAQADAADKNRKGTSSSGILEGIPILVKDNIATADKMNTTAGSLALLGSTVAGDAGVVEKLRKAGAIILGKASLSEWSAFRGFEVPQGWSARGGQGKNPYVPSASPCGSSSGSAISAAANLATVTLGTDTDGSIICPSSANSVVGIRPTVGLTSRSGVIPISLRQDTVGPICRTVSDAVHVLDAIVGVDPKDPETAKAAKFIPKGGYKQFLKAEGLKGKKLGIVRTFLFSLPDGPQTFDKHFATLKQQGASVVDNLEVPHIMETMNIMMSGEMTALSAELKNDLNAYLSALPKSPVKSLADIIKFNEKSAQEKTTEYGQFLFEIAENSQGINGNDVKDALKNLEKLSKEGLEKVMKDKDLDAVVFPHGRGFSLVAIGGNPAVTVPASYGKNGEPYGITFGGLKGYEPKLIEIAYGFEHATKARIKPPLAA